MKTLQVILSSDSDCYTIINQNETICDYTIFETFKVNKENFKNELDRIIKKISTVNYKPFGDSDIPSIMNSLTTSMIEDLNELKKEDIDKIIGKTYSSGGNQYYEIKLF